MQVWLEICHTSINGWWWLEITLRRQDRIKLGFGILILKSKSCFKNPVFSIASILNNNIFVNLGKCFLKHIRITVYTNSTELKFPQNCHLSQAFAFTKKHSSANIDFIQKSGRFSTRNGRPGYLIKNYLLNSTTTPGIVISAGVTMGKKKR